MGVPYDVFTGAFLSKVMEYDFVNMDQFHRDTLVDSYMKRSMANFNEVCKYDFANNQDDIIREFLIDVPSSDLDEISDIVSEGMIVQWLKPFVYHQANLENVLSTRDFTTYSPANLLSQMVSAHNTAKKNFTNMKREYSYRHGDLSDLYI